MRILTISMSGFVLATALLGGCNGNSPASGISTASLLDGKSSAGSADGANIKPDDPSAKSVQVAWTAARAQKCGYNFDAARLKSNYLAAEARDGAQQAQLAIFDKTYDATFMNVTNNLKGDEGYCSERRTASIKSDLQRHLAGNYQLNAAQEKKVASGGAFDFLKTDKAPEQFDQKNFWADMEARRQGSKSAQRAGE